MNESLRDIWDSDPARYGVIEYPLSSKARFLPGSFKVLLSTGEPKQVETGLTKSQVESAIRRKRQEYKEQGRTDVYVAFTVD